MQLPEGNREGVIMSQGKGRTARVPGARCAQTTVIGKRALGFERTF